VTDYHQGFITGFIPGVLLGMGLMKMAWDHEEKRRARRMGPPRGSYGPPHPTGGQVVDMYGRTIDPTTPKPDIIPKPQFPLPRVIPGDTP
jgi:hypothetical protein